MGMLQDLLEEIPQLTVVKERVALAEEAYERALKENEELKRRIAVLESEHARPYPQRPYPQRSYPPEPPAPRKLEIGEDTARVLVHLFRTKNPDERAVEALAVALTMERRVLQSHLDRLREANLAQMTGRNYASGHAYWAPTAEGQRFLVLGANR